MNRTPRTRPDGARRALAGFMAAGLLGVLFAAPAFAAVTVSGTIAANTTWTNSPDPIVWVTGTVTVNPGVTLTIEPGVTVKMNLYTDINVDGVLSAIGGTTPDSTIYFTSIRDDNLPPGGGDDTNGDGNATVPASSNWSSVNFRTPASSASVLQNCSLWFGGYYTEGIIVCDGADPTIQDSAIQAGYYGIQCLNGSDPTIDNTDVSACTSVPVAISIDSNPVFSSVTFSSTSDNAYDAIGILSTTLAAGANTIPVRGTTIGGSPIPNITYMLLGDVTISSGASLTIDPTVVIKPLNANVDFLVYGTLNAVGTAGNEVVFTSFKDDNYGDPSDTNNDGSTTAPASGDWGGLVLFDGSAATIDYCVVKYGGYSTNNANVWMNNTAAAVTVSNSLISDSYVGIEIRGVSDPTITGNTIANCTNVPFLMSVSSNPSFSGNTFISNGITALGLIPETVAVNSRLRVKNVAGYNNITYLMNGDLIMDVGAHLIVDPAVVVKFFNYYSSFDIRGSMSAVGTADPDSQVVFTSWQDDNHGNPADTNGNGSATSPSYNDWSWIKFAATSIDAMCELDYCFIGYGGFRPSYGFYASVWCESSAPAITHCDFWVDRIGVRCDGNSATTITNNDFFGNYSVPIIVSATATPTINNNTYDQNGYHAIGLISETVASNATLSPSTAGVNHPGQFGQEFPYFLVAGDLTIGSGVTLTIAPGVTIKSDYYGLNVYGGLIAEDLGGSDPIVFTDIKDDGHNGDSNVDGNATTAVNGDWSDIYFDGTSIDANCRMNGVEFWYGGSSPAVINMVGASPTITNCSFEFSYKGIWVQGLSNPTITNNLIRQSTWTPIVIDILSNPTFGGNVFDANGITALGYMGGNLGQDGTIPIRNLAGYTNITNVLDTWLTVQFGATLTIDPGVVLKLWDGGWPYYTVGAGITVAGGIVMDGTPGVPIIVTSVEDDTVGNPLDTNTDGALTTPAPGEWSAIYFNDVSDDSVSVVDEVTLRYGGNAWTPLYTVSASPTFSNTLIENSYADAITCTGVSNPTIDTCTFANNGRCPVTISLLSNPVMSNNVSTGNFYDAIGVIGETLAQNVTWTRRAFAGDDNREYILLNNMTVGTGANLTLQKGLVIKPLSGVNLFVKRGLFAQGGAEPESLIVFTSPYDDFYGGDTNGDGAATDGTNLRWGRIEIQPTALNANVVFENCVVNYGVWSSSYGAVTLQGSLSPDFTDCIFAHNYNSIDYQQASGDSLLGKVTGCDFFDNGGYAIKNTGLAHTVSARNCWWGDDSGPTHASNPTGTGDPITNMVEYAPWQGMGLGNYHMGDVSLNGEIHAYDGSLVLQHLVSAITLTPQQQVIGNVDCDGNLLAFDATQILQYVAEVIVTFPCLEIIEPARDVAQVDERGGPGPAGASPAASDAAAGDEEVVATAPDARGAWAAQLVDVDLRPGARVKVPVIVRGTGDIYSAQFTLRPDAGAIRILGIERGIAAEGAMFASHVDDEGVARIALASVTPLEAGTFAMLEVEVVPLLEKTAELAIEFGEAIVNTEDIKIVSVGSRGVINPVSLLPESFSLSQNHPKPFRPQTAVRFAIPPVVEGSVNVDLSIFGVDGRRIRTLASGPHAPGVYELRWDSRDENGSRVASGVYFYRLQAGSFTDQKKMVLLK